MPIKNNWHLVFYLYINNIAHLLLVGDNVII